MFKGDDIPPSLTALLHAPCASCKTNHCRGCFKRVACPVSCKGKSKNPFCTIEACCAQGRAIAIFEFLGGFDREYIGELASSDSRAQLALSKTKVKTGSSSVGPGGTGYGTGHRSSRPFRTTHPDAGSSSTIGRMNEADMRWEEIVIRAFNLLTNLLPSPYSESAQGFDLLPHASIGPLLSLSKIPELLARLLRNDSVTDWIVRRETYYAMLSLLRRMADSELTVQVLIEPRREIAVTQKINSWMWGEEIVWRRDKDGVIETAPPLYNYFKKLTKQCETFLVGASDLLDSGDDDELMQGTSLCGDIIAARDDMERAMSVLNSASTSTAEKPRRERKNVDTASSLDLAYSHACERLAFQHVVFVEAPSSDKGKEKAFAYSFGQNLHQSQGSTRNPKDRLHFIKELAMMATSLPPGVWVRVDEVRNDAM